MSIILNVSNIDESLNYEVINTKISGAAGGVKIKSYNVAETLHKVDGVHLVGLDSYIILDKEHTLRRVFNDKFKIFVDVFVDEYETATEMELVNNKNNISIRIIGLGNDGKNSWRTTANGMKDIIKLFIINECTCSLGIIYSIPAKGTFSELYV